MVRFVLHPDADVADEVAPDPRHLPTDLVAEHRARGGEEEDAGELRADEQTEPEAQCAGGDRQQIGTFVEEHLGAFAQIERHVARLLDTLAEHVLGPLDLLFEGLRRRRRPGNVLGVSRFHLCGSPFYVERSRRDLRAIGTPVAFASRSRRKRGLRQTER